MNIRTEISNPKTHSLKDLKLSTNDQMRQGYFLIEQEERLIVFKRPVNSKWVIR